MMPPRRLFVLSLFVLFLLLGSGPWVSAGTAAPGNDASAEVENLGFAGRLKAGLETQGLEVKEGYFKLWGIEECPDSFGVIKTCYFNNPTAPYILPVLPYWSDEFVDPALEGAFGKTRPGYGATFRFDPNEAIAMCGFLPPEAAYFGIQSYLFTRVGESNTNNPTYETIAAIQATEVFFHRVPNNQDRVMLFSSLSNATNNVVIQQQSDGCWEQFRCFIITPNQRMERRVRDVLHELSIADRDIFAEGIPSNMQVGLNADADDFVIGLRYSLPTDGGEKGTPSDRWRHHPAMRILRIRDAGSSWPSEPYPEWVDDSPEQREAVDETWLQEDLLTLVQAVSDQWGQPCSPDTCPVRALRFIDTQSSPFNLVGPLCDNIGMDCLGDTQDASYQFRPVLFDDNAVYAVVGTLGTATGNATYVSLGVNNSSKRLGALNVEGKELEGSATPEKYPGLDNLDLFYVYYFTRDCEGLEHLTGGYCKSVENSEWVVPSGGKATFVERDYLKEGTQRGPDSSLTLPSRVLKLQRPVP